MHNILLIGDTFNENLKCIDKDDIGQDPNIDSLLLATDEICEILSIDQPEIGLMRHNPIGKNSLYAISYGTYELESPDKPVILLFWNNIEKYVKSRAEYIGIFAHEIRHVYQKSNGERPANAKGYEALADKHEIDADGFAICYIAYHAKISLAEAADIVCVNEKTASPKWFDARLKRATDIEPIFKKSIEKKNKQNSFESKPKKGIFRKFINIFIK